MQTAPQTVGVPASKEQDHDDIYSSIGERKKKHYGNTLILMRGPVNRERGRVSPYCNNTESKLHCYRLCDIGIYCVIVQRIDLICDETSDFHQLYQQYYFEEKACKT